MTDLRYAFRLLRQSRLFTLTIVLTLTIGIGATTAIFSVVNAELLQPLPFAEPGRLMQVAEKNDSLRLRAFGASALNYLSWKEQTRTPVAVCGTRLAGPGGRCVSADQLARRQSRLLQNASHPAGAGPRLL